MCSKDTYMLLHHYCYLYYHFLSLFFFNGGNIDWKNSGQKQMTVYGKLPPGNQINRERSYIAHKHQWSKFFFTTLYYKVRKHFSFSHPLSWTKKQMSHFDFWDLNNRTINKRVLFWFSRLNSQIICQHYLKFVLTNRDMTIPRWQRQGCEKSTLTKLQWCTMMLNDA